MPSLSVTPLPFLACSTARLIARTPEVKELGGFLTLMNGPAIAPLRRHLHSDVMFSLS